VHQGGEARGGQAQIAARSSEGGFEVRIAEVVVEALGQGGSAPTQEVRRRADNMRYVYRPLGVARALRKARASGSIINMTSVSGMLGNLGQINESAAKAGIYGLTRTASIELQKYGVRANAISAIAKTRLTEDLPMFEKAGDSMSPAHVAPAALFLGSDLSAELSGTVLSVAGGRISTFELAESQGRLKEAEGGLWTPWEIAENYDSIAKK